MISSGRLLVEEGERALQGVSDTGVDDLIIGAFCRVERAALEAMSGRSFKPARALLAEGAQVIDELGLTVLAAVIAQEAFFVETLGGDVEKAAEILHDSYETLEQMGERSYLSTIAGFLAQALYTQGEYDEAEGLSRASEAAAAANDVVSQVLWRSARAKIKAQRGEIEEAQALAREAVEIVETTDLLNTQGDAFSDLAEVLTVAERLEYTCSRPSSKRLPPATRARETGRRSTAPVWPRESSL